MAVSIVNEAVLPYKHKMAREERICRISVFDDDIQAAVGERRHELDQTTPAGRER